MLPQKTLKRREIGSIGAMPNAITCEYASHGKHGISHMPAKLCRGPLNPLCEASENLEPDKPRLDLKPKKRQMAANSIAGLSKQLQQWRVDNPRPQMRHQRALSQVIETSGRHFTAVRDNVLLRSAMELCLVQTQQHQISKEPRRIASVLYLKTSCRSS